MWIWACYLISWNQQFVLLSKRIKNQTIFQFFFKFLLPSVETGGYSNPINVGWFQTLVYLRQCPWLLYLSIIAVSGITDSRIYISFHWKASSFLFLFLNSFCCICKWMSRVSGILTKLYEWVVGSTPAFENDHFLTSQFM